MGKILSRFHKNNNPDNIYHYKGNRRYINLSNVNYLYPIDDNELDRVQHSHDLFRQVWNNNFSAPVEELLETGAKILDIGCGPAMWTLEMATDYERSNFTGVDVAPTYPTLTKPCNVEFFQANVITGLPFADNTFDYVVCRSMLFAFTLKDWAIATREICRVCKVGGYIEFMEKDILFWNEGDFTRNARLKFSEALRTKKKIETIISPKIPQYISETKHFPIIYHAERIVPIGRWGGQIGEDYRYVYDWGAKNLKHVMKGCGYNEREWESIVEGCMSDLSNNRGYDKVHRFWAQKEEFQQEMEIKVIKEEETTSI